MIPTIKFENGNEIPIIGYGTYMLTDVNTMYQSILYALNSGYKMLDTAKWYNNEWIVAKALEDSKVKREDIFITSKQESKGYYETMRNVHETLDIFKTNYLDLVLVHWPTTKENDKSTYEALEDLVDQGLVKSIGISNYNTDQCEELLKTCRIKPQVNQIETNIYFQENKMNKYLKEKNIIHEGWSPFREGYGDMLQNEVLIDIGKKYHKTPAQVALRFFIEKNIVMLPRSTNPVHIKENLEIFDFKLTKEEKNKIKKIDQKLQYSGWPECMKQETNY